MQRFNLNYPMHVRMPGHVKKDAIDREIMAAPEVIDYFNRRFDVIGRHDKVTESNKIHIRFTYPLTEDVVMSFESPSGKGFTKDDFYKCVYDGYMQIYKTRSDTIWGHSMDDLFLEEVIYDEKSDVYELCVGS